ncbi:hypothetical protein BgiMline_025377 [Biomphalaria glabrata]
MRLISLAILTFHRNFADDQTIRPHRGWARIDQQTLRKGVPDDAVLRANITRDYTKQHLHNGPTLSAIRLPDGRDSRHGISVQNLVTWFIHKEIWLLI